MSVKKVPPCTVVAGDGSAGSPRPVTVIVIALVFGFEAALIASGVDVVTTVVLVAAGVLTAGLAAAKPLDVPAAVKQLAALVRLLPGPVTP